MAAYHAPVTTSGYLALSVGLALVGVVAGFLVGRRTAPRRPRRPQGLTVADLTRQVVQESHDGIAVLNEFGDVVLHNPRAEELGVVRNNRVDDRARRAAELVKETDEAVDVDLSPLEAKGRQPEAVHARGPRC